MENIISLNRGYNKRFPSDFSLSYKTFLNDKGISAEIYAVFLGLSKVVENSDGKKMTFVKRGDINKTKIAEMLDITRPTLNSKIMYLKEKGYLIEHDDGYEICVNEKCYLDIPVETLWYLQDTLKEEVIKVYIYLGVRYNYKNDYQFTLEELGVHCGINLRTNNPRHYVKLNNILNVLSDCGLIKWVEVRVGKENRKQLVYWKNMPESLYKQMQEK